MNIITSIPSDAAVRDALIREIKTGFQLIKENEKAKEMASAREASAMKGHRTISGLGKCVAVMPKDEYFRLVKKMGHNEVHSREFLGYFNKKFPHLSPNKA